MPESRPCTQAVCRRPIPASEAYCRYCGERQPAPTPAAAAPAPPPAAPVAAPVTARPAIPAPAATPGPVPGRLRFLNGPREGECVSLGPRPLTVGRTEDNDIVLPAPNVSRLHVKIGYSQGQPLLQDQKSTNGTWVNDAAVTLYRLQPGDQIRIGDFLIGVEAGG